MLLLCDIGNTHCHLGLASHQHVLHQTELPTASIATGRARHALRRWVGRRWIEGAVLCSVVPGATPGALALIREVTGGARCLQLSHRTVTGVGVDYPRPSTIGADRLANAIAARHFFGAPVVVVDFGTAVTFDVVDRQGNYIGGIIAPGLSMMTDYLYEKTALLPRIRVRDIASVVGRSTESAMLVGAVHGYGGLVRELIRELKRELRARRLPVVATGGDAALIARRVAEITAVQRALTLEGLRLAWLGQHLPDRTRG